MKTKTQKPMITILGSDHLDNPGINFINTQYDDVLLPHRQREMDTLVEKLKAYNPTKIALTIDDRLECQYPRKLHNVFEGCLSTHAERI